MAISRVNAIQNLYKALMTLLPGITIKYVFKGEECETLETKQAADQYLSALRGEDTFLSYNDFTDEEYAAVGLTDEDIIQEVKKTGLTSSIPYEYRDPLLKLRRQRTIDEYVEKNDYYRKLEGYPNYKDEGNIVYTFYVTPVLAETYGIDPTIPVHQIQDYYNKKDGTGDYLIAMLEGIGYIEELKTKAEERIQIRLKQFKVSPDEVKYERTRYEYLDFIGQKRIPITTSRPAKNFEIIRLLPGDVSYKIYNPFMEIYEQCREYFMSTIYIPQFREFIEYYDNFIGMCIMLMAFLQIVMRQIPYALRRSFFDLYSIKALYEAYDVPYNLKLDSTIQDRIVQNLNMLVQAKATDKVLFDITSVLGLGSNVTIYKYFLGKQRLFDDYGTPIIAMTERFDTDTGEVYTDYDYEKMFEVYFQKADLKSNELVSAFGSKFSHATYEEITQADPFWHEDSNVFKQVWENEYNYVESKYLGVAISYKLTDLVFKNITLLKLIMNYEPNTGLIMTTLPKILGGNMQVSIFDCIIALICLMGSKHNLKGEIISIPTQVIAVLDFMQNVDGGQEFLVDTLGIELEYFKPSNLEGRENILQLRDLLAKNVSQEDADKFMGYVQNLSMNIELMDTESRGTAINEIYENTKLLYTFLNWMLTKTHDMRTYIAVKTFYRAAFYSREVKDTFTVTGETTGKQRTAWDFFEFLYYRNPTLYEKLYKVDFHKSYTEYLQEHGLTPLDLSYDDYIVKYENGEIKIDFSTLNAGMVEDESTKDEFIYFNANHIITRLSTYIKNIESMSLLADLGSILEDMLRRFIIFFKSYTVELISFENIIICDMKMENILRFFDELTYMRKTLELHTGLNISYNDLMHRYVHMISNGGKAALDDFMRYSVTLTPSRDDNCIPFHDNVRIKKFVSYIEKMVALYDVANKITINMKTKDRFRFKDSVRVSYSDDDETLV